MNELYIYMLILMALSEKELIMFTNHFVSLCSLSINVGR